MYINAGRACAVQRQLFLPLVLPHLRMLPAILRMIVPAVSGESGARGAPGADRSGCSRGRYVTVCNRLVGVDGTERTARYQERRKAGGSRYRRPADGRVKRDHGGTVG